MRPEAGKVYRDGRGLLVHIMGPARRDDGVEAVWSLEGNHYRAEDGRRIGWERSETRGLRELVGEHSDGGKGEGWAHALCTVCYPVSSRRSYRVVLRVHVEEADSPEDAARLALARLRDETAELPTARVSDFETGHAWTVDLSPRGA